MNSYKRVMATIKGEIVDRRPVGGVLSLYGAKLIGCDLEAYYQKPEYYMAGQNAVIEILHPDYIISPLCTGLEAKAFGCDIRYFQNYPPNIKRRAIDSASELSSLKMMDYKNDQGTNYILESIRLLATQHKDQVPMGAVWMDPLDILALVVGLETFMELLIFRKSAFNEVIEQLIPICSNYGNAMLDAGADFLINFASACNSAIVTREMAETVVGPILEKTYCQIKGSIILHAGGARMAPYFDIYQKLPNIIGFNTDSRDNLKFARSKAGVEKVLIGNIDGPSFDKKTPEQIKRISKYLLNEMSEDMHYILGTSAADIPYNTTKEQILALMNAPKEFEEMRE